MSVSLSDYPWFPAEWLQKPRCNESTDPYFFRSLGHMSFGGGPIIQEFLIPGPWGFYSNGTPWYRDIELSKDTLLPVAWVDTFNNNNRSTDPKNLGTADFALESQDSLYLDTNFTFNYTQEDVWYPTKSKIPNFFTVPDECGRNVTAVGVPFSLFFRHPTGRNKYDGMGQYEYSIRWKLGGGYIQLPFGETNGGKEQTIYSGFKFFGGESWLDSEDAKATVTSSMAAPTGSDSNSRTKTGGAGTKTVTGAMSTTTVTPTGSNSARANGVSVRALTLVVMASLSILQTSIFL